MYKTPNTTCPRCNRAEQPVGRSARATLLFFQISAVTNTLSKLIGMLVQEIIVLLDILLGFGGLQRSPYYLRLGTTHGHCQLAVMSETTKMKKARALVSAVPPHTATQH